MATGLQLADRRGVQLDDRLVDRFGDLVATDAIAVSIVGLSLRSIPFITDRRALAVVCCSTVLMSACRESPFI